MKVATIVLPMPLHLEPGTVLEVAVSFVGGALPVYREIIHAPPFAAMVSTITLEGWPEGRP